MIRAALFSILAAAAAAACSSGASASTVGAPAATAIDERPTAFAVDVPRSPGDLHPGVGPPGSVWRDIAAHFGDARYETHVLTLAGFAGQPRIDGPLARTTRDQLARYIHPQPPPRSPDRHRPQHGWLHRLLARRRRARAGRSDDWVRSIFGSMAQNRERLIPFLDDIARSDRGALGDAIYELYTTDVRPELPEIHAPVLAVLADGSSQAQFRSHANKVPDHHVVVVPNTGHFVMLDDPAMFESTVDRFLAAEL